VENIIGHISMQTWHHCTSTKTTTTYAMI